MDNELAVELAETMIEAFVNNCGDDLDRHDYDTIRSEEFKNHLAKHLETSYSNDEYEELDTGVSYQISLVRDFLDEYLYGYDEWGT